ncbi:MAG: DNA-protecting protein DprA [Helicobacter sp.]|nr:DNA-protecting protein DprA [Helicobacter sp.]
MRELLPIPQALLPLKLQKLYYCGRKELLDLPKVSIVGTRNPNPYAQSFTREIAAKIAKEGVIIVSGGALGIDIIAHKAALPNTLMVSPSSLDIIYPKSNQAIIERIYEEALIISQFEPVYKPKAYSFLERNKIVINLGDFVIIPQADLKSGSFQSAKYALKIGKKIYVPPHRIGESQGTGWLIQQGLAEVIWDIDDFIQNLYPKKAICKTQKDEILEYCKSNPFFEEAYLKFGEKIFEYELEGKIFRKNGRIEVL